MNINELTAKIAELDAMGITALRTEAKGIVKSYAKYNVKDLRAALVAHYTEQLVEEPKAEAAAPTAKGLCIVCAERKGMTAAQRTRCGASDDFSDMCEACYEESGYENQHSDEGHQTGTGDKGGDIDGCWICFPELKADFISATYRPRGAGTSRAAMRLTVQVHAAGETKATTTAAKFAAIGADVKIKVGKTQVKLTVKVPQETGTLTIELFWAVTGAYIYGPSNVGGTKVRNVSAALKSVGL